MNNLGKMLAALLVATASLTVAPMATATNNVPCVNSDGSMSLISGTDDYERSDALSALPEAEDLSDVWTLDLSSISGTFTVKVAGLNGDPAPLLLVYQEISGVCVPATPTSSDPQAFEISGGKFHIQVLLPNEEAATALDYRIEAVTP